MTDRFDGLNWDDDEGYREEPDPHGPALYAMTWSEVVRASIRIRLP